MTTPVGERLSGRPAALLATFVRHRTAANLLMALMILFGIVGLTRINTQFFPTVDVPRITVSVAWPGASAEDVEESILEAVEPALRFLDALDKTTSYAREGSASVTLEFAQGADMQKALADVEAAVAGVATLPEGAEDPKISRSVFYETVAVLSLSGPFEEAALRAFARQIRDDLLAAGIDRVVFEGYRDREVEIALTDAALSRLGLTLADVAARVGQATLDTPSGSLEGAIEKQLRAISRHDDVTSYGGIEVLALPSGERVLLRDVATIRETFDADQPAGFQEGRRAIELTVQRTASADTLESAAIVLDYLERIRPSLPPTLVLDVYDVRADLLNERIGLLVDNGLQGLLIVLVVLFVFLNARVAFWVAAGIPTAMMATVGLMWLTGQSINMISLFSMIMMLGIIVDDAIVVGEHTATRFAAGDPAVLAAETGAGRMFWPVVAATLTTQAAFLPLFFISDTVGQIMSALPLVVIVALTASLIESFLVLPGHLRHGLSSSRAEPGRVRRAVDRAFDRLRDRHFRGLVALSFRWRYVTVALAVASLVLAVGFLAGGRVGFQFFPSPEPENVTARIEFAAGTPEAEVAAVLARVEAALAEAEAGFAAGELVSAHFALVGKSGFSRGMNLAEISVQLTPSEFRSVRTSEFMRAWRARLPQIPGVERLTISARVGGPPGRDLDVRLKGAAPEVLKQAAIELRDILSGYPGVSAVADDLPFGKPEIVMALTERGAALGFTAQSVGRQVRDAFEGALARRVADGDEEVEIRVKRAAPLDGVGGLIALELVAPDGTRVALSEVVALSERQGFAAIQRIDGTRTVAVTADVDPAVMSGIALVEALSAGPLPELALRHGLDYEFSGREEERRRSFADMRQGALIGLALIYLTLAWVFASYLRPIAVMLIIPFGFVGAVLGHYVMGFPLTILSVMGLLGLSGILVNDSIILAARAAERGDQGEPVAGAVIGASCDRLRAVLLTSLTTVGGLTPLLFEKSLQAQFLLPMAITLVFGLSVATLFVLFLVPALLGIGNDLRTLWGTLTGARPQPAPAAE